MVEFRQERKQRIERAEVLELFKIINGEDQLPTIKVHCYHAVVQMLRDMITRAPLHPDSSQVILLNPDNLHYCLNFTNGEGVLLRAEIYFGYLLIDGKWFDTLDFPRLWNVLNIIISLEEGVVA